MSCPFFTNKPRRRTVTNDLQQPLDKDAIRAKLVQMIRLASAHGIDIEALIYEALDIADVEPR
jgi:hypothetical protein